MALELTARIDHRDVEVALTLASGETLAIMGPNGAGKSSVLAALAGLLRPDTGSAVLNGRELFNAGPRRNWVPPHQRGTGMLAQDPLLFPHLSVLDNVAFGPRNAGAGRSSARATAQHWLEEVGVPELADRRPAQLSGGQAQRVAMARALATDPQLLLLDEPMAALDIHSAPLLRRLLKRVLAGRSTIMVTHDVLDALVLADRIIVMDRGRIVEEGPTAAVLGHPRSPFAASLAGLNVMMGALRGASVLTGDGVTVTGRLADAGTPDGDPCVAGAPAVAGVAAFSPSAVSVFLAPPQGSPRNCFALAVTELEPHGDLIRVRSGRLAADVTPAAVAELGLVPGMDVFFVVKATEVSIYPA